MPSRLTSTDNWWMRFHDRTLNIKWKKGVKRPEKSNAIDMLCSGQVPPRSEFEKEDYERNFEEVPQPFSAEERQEWLEQLTDVAISSDAFVSLCVPPCRYCKAPYFPNYLTDELVLIRFS